MPIPPPGGMPPGWGAGGWGSSGWGGPSIPIGAFALVSAVAIAENVVQLVFNQPVYYSGLLDTPDASQPRLFDVEANTSTVGYDGNPARQATAILITQAVNDLPPGTQVGAALDVSLDRSLSPYPTVYSISIAGLYTADLSLAITPVTMNFYGLFRELVRPTVDTPTLSRDVANPSSLSQTIGLANAQDPAALGVFSVDSSGDYAIDSGLPSYKKRILRRLITRPGGFLHLGKNYGVGIPQQGKKLARPSTIQQLATQAQKQIGEEPETQACTVTAVPDPDHPGFTRFPIVVRMKGGKAMKFAPAFPTS